jgi:integrase
MLTLEEEQRILENAPPYLRVAIVLLAQTGGRTYTEGFSLRWDQIDFDHKVMFFGGDTQDRRFIRTRAPDGACT